MHERQMQYFHGAEVKGGGIDERRGCRAEMLTRTAARVTKVLVL